MRIVRIVRIVRRSFPRNIVHSPFQPVFPGFCPVRIILGRFPRNIRDRFPRIIPGRIVRIVRRSFPRNSLPDVESSGGANRFPPASFLATGRTCGAGTGAPRLA
jgi:hypothetical protein